MGYFMQNGVNISGSNFFILKLKISVMKIKNLYIILLFISVLFSACSSSSDDTGTDDDSVIPDPIVPAFTSEISASDPKVLLLNNTTIGEGFDAYWDYGLGDGLIEDQPGIEEVTYDTTGQYTITLTVSKSGVTSTANTTINVDADGICPNGNCGSSNGEGLKGAATTFAVGMITRQSRVTSGGQHTQALVADFNSLTSEYEMKMNVMYPSEGNYDFSAADAIVSFAQENNMFVHGHALIWHNATPSWVENFSGTDSEFETMVEDYITTTVQRYSGTVRSWDVVNEAVEDGSNILRNSVFRQKMGDNYIQKCFQFARNADPNVLLFYNDYNFASNSGKRAAIFNIADSLGSLIDGLGSQMHISINGPSASNIQAVADGTISRGLKLHFSELDIRTNPEGDSNVTFLSFTKAQQQKDKFEEVVNIYNSIPLDNKYALTLWGLRDSESWLLDFWGVPDWPLLFDDSYNQKPAYQGFLDGLQ